MKSKNSFNLIMWLLWGCWMTTIVKIVSKRVIELGLVLSMILIKILRWPSDVTFAVNPPIPHQIALRGKRISRDNKLNKLVCFWNPNTRNSNQILMNKISHEGK